MAFNFNLYTYISKSTCGFLQVHHNIHVFKLLQNCYLRLNKCLVMGLMLEAPVSSVAELMPKTSRLLRTHSLGSSISNFCRFKTLPSSISSFHRETLPGLVVMVQLDTARIKNKYHFRTLVLFYSLTMGYLLYLVRKIYI